MTTFDYSTLLPPLSDEEFEALRASIRQHGVHDPIWEDEDGNVLDGNHRLKIDPNAPRRVKHGLSLPEKIAFVFQSNYGRRNLSPAQQQENLKKKRQAAKLFDEELGEDGRRKWSHEEIAKQLLVHRTTVSKWLITDVNGHNRNKTNGKAGKRKAPTPRTHSQVKLYPEQKDEVYRQVVKEGKSQAQVAANYGVSQPSISKIVTVKTKENERRREREALVRSIVGDCGVIHGDMRKAGLSVPDASVDLIFTDPLYRENSIGLYRDLAEFAARVLIPGGLLLSYSGQAFLLDVGNALRGHGLEWGWEFGVLHKGGDTRFRKLKIRNGWKPILALYKPPLAATWPWFRDVVSGGKQKTHHCYQQSLPESEYFIERLSSPGGFVCDPFCGSGTSLRAAKNLNRRWIGFDVDKEAVDTARARLMEEKEGG
jgi:site-specific DNA-methyltransferase (adenine-specific)